MADDPRFLTLADVAEVLNTSGAQVYALVRRGELPAIKIGGRGQWRVERVQLEEFIQRMYAQTKEFVDQTGRRKVKGKMDIELAVDAMEIAGSIDHMVLFSGDGDFRSLVEALQHKGKRVSVVSTLVTTPPMVADELRRQADQFIDLAHLQNEIGRDPAERAQREQRRRPEPVDEFESEDLIET